MKKQLKSIGWLALAVILSIGTYGPAAAAQAPAPAVALARGPLSAMSQDF